MMEPDKRKKYFEDLWPPRNDKIKAAVLDAFESGKWSRIIESNWNTSWCGQFEKMFADYVNAKHCLCIENGTRALELCLHVLNIKSGDEVIVPACSFVATATAIAFVGAIPVMVDVNKSDININYQEIEKAVTDKTKAIIIVHLGGVPCQMDRIVDVVKKHNLFLIEDCSHAHGSEWRGKRVGSFGDLGVFSLQQGKLITSGEGAAVVTNDFELYNKLFSVHQFQSSMPVGCIDNYVPLVSTNGRLTNIQGAILTEQLKNITETDSIRLDNLRYLLDRMNEIDGIKPLVVNDENVTRYLGYYISFVYDKTCFGEMENTDFVFHMSDLGFPFFKGHNSPMYEREPFASNPELYRKLDCSVAENYAKNNIINIRHEILLADKSVVDEMIDTIKRIKNDKL